MFYMESVADAKHNLLGAKFKNESELKQEYC